MTRRARSGAVETMAFGLSRMAPGGRKSAAESPVRPLYRLVGAAGEEPAAACGPDIYRDSMGSTSAHFFVADPEGYPLWVTSVSITWTGAGGDVAWRVASLDPKPGDPPGFDNTPTPWVTVDTSTGSGFSTTADMIGWDAGSIVGFTVEWDTPGGFTDVCAEFTEGG